MGKFSPCKGRGVGLVLLVQISAIGLASSALAADLTVAMRDIDDRKAVFATVQSTDTVQARARIAGMVVSLAVDEGSQVKQGQTIAIIGDEKLGLKLRALDARIEALQARVTKARNDLDRNEPLRKRGVISEARIDILRTAFNVAANELKSIQAERSVVQQQLEEGAVLAPAGGRILSAPVTEGAFVMPGESLATVAANRYILRLELPERHARFIKNGDGVTVGSRGLVPGGKAIGAGRIVKVYPRLDKGRVLADAEVKGLGDYFVGERVLVWVSAGKRHGIAVPKAYTFKRYGLDYVRLARDGGDPFEIVVQLGQTLHDGPGGGSVEVLAGLKPGDRLVKP